MIKQPPNCRKTIVDISPVRVIESAQRKESLGRPVCLLSLFEHRKVVRILGVVESSSQKSSFGLQGGSLSMRAATKAWSRQRILFLAIQFAEHFVVALATLFRMATVRIRVAKHLVHLHATATIDGGSSRPRLWRWCLTIVAYGAIMR